MEAKKQGKRFKLFLTKSKLKQKDVAKIFNCYSTDITKLINGAMHLQKYSKQIYFLGCNLNWLLTGEGSMYADNKAGKELKVKYEEPEYIQEENIGNDIEDTNNIDLDEIFDEMKDKLINRLAAAGKLKKKK